MKEKKNHRINFRVGDKLHTELMEEALKESQNLTKYIISVLNKRVKKSDYLPKQSQKTKTTNSIEANWFLGLLCVLILAVYVSMFKRK